MQGHHEVVAELASRGADLEATDEAGRTAVWVGVESLEVMRVRMTVPLATGWHEHSAQLAMV